MKNVVMYGKKDNLRITKRMANTSIIGTMASEGRQRMVTWLKLGKAATLLTRSNQVVNRFHFGQSKIVLQYIKRFSIPYASVYGEILQD